MNMLLFAPGVLLVLLISTSAAETILCLSICAGLQLALGYPFLARYPREYLTRAFDLNRVFTYKWTVNFKFLSEDVFLQKSLSVLLLVLTVIGKIESLLFHWYLMLFFSTRSALNSHFKLYILNAFYCLFCHARLILVNLFCRDDFILAEMGLWGEPRILLLTAALPSLNGQGAIHTLVHTLVHTLTHTYTHSYTHLYTHLFTLIHTHSYTHLKR